MSQDQENAECVKCGKMVAYSNSYFTFPGNAKDRLCESCWFENLIEAMRGMNI